MSGAPYLVAVSALMIALVDTLAICPIVDGPSYVLPTSFMAWHTMECADWEAVPSMSTTQLLPFFKTSMVSVFSGEGSARLW